MDEDERARFEAAVEQKKQAAKAASEQPQEQTSGGSGIDGDEPSLTEHGRPQDVRDPRKKNAGHLKKTADKWNQ